MGQLIGRGDYAEALLAAMADGSRADGPRVGSPVRPLDSARSFAERFRRQRERRAARELLNAARLEGRAEARRLARDADRAIATPIVGAEGPTIGPGAGPGTGPGREFPHTPIPSGRGQSRVWVAPYTRADGTRVDGHWRVNPNPARDDRHDDRRDPLLVPAALPGGAPPPDAAAPPPPTSENLERLTPLARAAAALLRPRLRDETRRVYQGVPRDYTPHELDAWRDPRRFIPLGVYVGNGSYLVGQTIVRANSATDIINAADGMVYRRNDIPPFPDAAHCAQQVNIFGRLGGMLGLDDAEGTRRNTTWAQAWENTWRGASLVNALHSAGVAIERGFTERHGIGDSTSAGFGLEAGGAFMIAGAPGGILAGRGALGSRPPPGPRLVPAPDLDTLGLYSRLSRAANSPQFRERGTPQEMISELRRLAGSGADDEMRWTGLLQMLEDHARASAEPGANVPRTIAREEIGRFLDANRVQIIERRLGGRGDLPTEYDTFAINPYSNYRERLFQWLRPGEQVSIDNLARLVTKSNRLVRSGDPRHAELYAAYRAALAEHDRRFPQLPHSTGTISMPAAALPAAMCAHPTWRSLPGTAGRSTSATSMSIRTTGLPRSETFSARLSS